MHSIETCRGMWWRRVDIASCTHAFSFLLCAPPQDMRIFLLSSSKSFRSFIITFSFFFCRLVSNFPTMMRLVRRELFRKSFQAATSSRVFDRFHTQKAWIGCISTKSSKSISSTTCVWDDVDRQQKHERDKKCVQQWRLHFLGLLWWFELCARKRIQFF